MNGWGIGFTGYYTELIAESLARQLRIERKESLQLLEEKIMTVLIIGIGALTFLVGIVIAVNPELILDALQKQLGTTKLHVLNIVLRVGFGVLLISQSDISKFTIITKGIGGFCIAIAIALTLMGRKRFNHLISWALSLIESYSRVGGILIMTFGAFLIYAFV